MIPVGHPVPLQLSAFGELPDPALNSGFSFFIFILFHFFSLFTPGWISNPLLIFSFPRGEKAKGMNPASAGPRSCPCTCAGLGDGWEGRAAAWERLPPKLCFLFLPPTSNSVRAAGAGTCTGSAAAGKGVPMVRRVKTLLQGKKTRGKRTVSS